MSSASDPEKKELAKRRNADGEHRLPPAIAVAVAGVIYALLPGSLLFVPRYVIPGLEVLLLISLILTNPRRMTRETKWSRLASIVLACVIIVTNFVALGLLVRALTESDTPGGALLVAAMQVWLTNIIGFALLYWEIDRGGAVPDAGAALSAAPADFRFSQDENHDAVREVSIRRVTSDWVPTFVDYLYVSTTNSTAFSPTDTMPLTSRAKLLMAAQSIAALITSLLVIARAVGSLGG